MTNLSSDDLRDIARLLDSLEAADSAASLTLSAVSVTTSGGETAGDLVRVDGRHYLRVAVS